MLQAPSLQNNDTNLGNANLGNEQRLLLNLLGVNYLYNDQPTPMALKTKVGRGGNNGAKIIRGNFGGNSKSMEAIDYGPEFNTIDNLEALDNYINNFTNCELRAGATNTVIGCGSMQSGLMIIGEAPGEQEDLQGLPFVGQSGKLLDNMLATIGLNRETIYVSNMLPWRPPANRQPSSNEIRTCLPFILKRVELLKPKVILLLGGTAAKSLLNTNLGILQIRQTPQFLNIKTLSIEGGLVIPAVATLHPAYLLRSPSQKAFAWQDLLKVKSLLECTVN